MPGHRQQMFASAQPQLAELAITDWLTERVISLPMHTELEEEQLQHITQAVLSFL